MSWRAVPEPGQPLLQRERFGVKRGRGGEDVMVLDVVDDPRVIRGREADRTITHTSRTGDEEMDQNVIRRSAA